PGVVAGADGSVEGAHGLRGAADGRMRPAAADVVELVNCGALDGVIDGGVAGEPEGLDPVGANERHAAGNGNRVVLSTDVQLLVGAAPEGLHRQGVVGIERGHTVGEISGRQAAVALHADVDHPGDFVPGAV